MLWVTPFQTTLTAGSWAMAGHTFGDGTVKTLTDSAANGSPRF